MYVQFVTPYKKLRLLLAKLGIKSAKTGPVVWDPAANGGQGAEYEY